MVEDVEELGIESQLHSLGQRKPFGDVKIAPEKVGAAQCIATEVSELAVLRRVATVASSGSRVNRGDERIGIEPLNRAGLSNARNVAMAAIGIGSRHKARKLRSAALHDAIPIRRVGST